MMLSAKKFWELHPTLFIFFILLSFICFDGEIFAKTQDEKLEKGAIIVERTIEDGVEGIKIKAIIDAPIETTWEVMTDYENFKDFMPHTKEAKILKREDKREKNKEKSIVYLQMVIKILFISAINNSKHELTVEKDKMIDCWEEAKDEYEYKGKKPIRFKENSGCWTLERHGKNRTKVTGVMRVEIESTEIPKSIVNRIKHIFLKLSASGIIKAARKRIKDKYSETKSKR